MMAFYHMAGMKWPIVLLAMFCFLDFTTAFGSGVNVVQKLKKAGKMKPPKPRETTTMEPPTTTPPPLCRDMYEYFDGGYQWKYFDVSANYTQAEEACAADEARLVVIPDKWTDYYLSLFMIDMGHPDDTIFIGLKQTGNTTYMWNTGDIITIDPEIAMSVNEYEYFESKEDKDMADMPGKSERDDQDCIEKEGVDEVFKWEDDECYDTNYFVCECPP